MNIYLTYTLIAALLVAGNLIYFRIAPPPRNTSVFFVYWRRLNDDDNAICGVP